MLQTPKCRICGPEHSRSGSHATSVTSNIMGGQMSASCHPQARAKNRERAGLQPLLMAWMTKGPLDPRGTDRADADASGFSSGPNHAHQGPLAILAIGSAQKQAVMMLRQRCRAIAREHGGIILPNGRMRTSSWMTCQPGNDRWPSRLLGKVQLLAAAAMTGVAASHISRQGGQEKEGSPGGWQMLHRTAMGALSYDQSGARWVLSWPRFLQVCLHYATVLPPMHKDGGKST